MKTTKRLFSWLVVLAMVLSMVPVFDLPAFAATTEAEETAEPVRFPSDVETYEAECPVCKTTATWKPYNGENYSEASGVVLTGAPGAHFHLYLTKDQTYESGKYFLASYRNVCFNLNGYSITATEGSKSAFMDSQTLSIIDTFGGSVVTGYANAASTGAAIHVNGGDGKAVVNLYGGTYKKLAADTAASIVRVSNNGGTINLYDGAVIDGSDAQVVNNSTGVAVSLAGKIVTTTAEDGTTTSTKQYATFNMYGGEIKGGTGVSGGAVQVGAYSTTNLDVAVFNLMGGKVSGGTAVDTYKADGTVNLSGAGGNFSVHYGGVLNISGGVIADGYVASAAAGGNWGGNIRAWNGNVNISGGLIYGGNGGKQLAGANVSVYSDAAGNAAGRGFLTISGGTIVGDVATTAKNSTTLTISGAPKIVTSMEIDGETVNAVSGGLTLVANAGLDVSKLSAEADIAISGISAGGYFTAASDNAAAVATCFKAAGTKYVGKAASDNRIYMAEPAAPGAANLTADDYTKLAKAAKVVNTDAAIDAHIAAKTCPMCGATNVTWTDRSENGFAPSINTQSGQKKHYYFANEISTTTNFVQMVDYGGTSSDNTICVALKSTAKITCTTYRVQIGGTNNVLNIMGTGTLIADQGSKDADLGLFQMDAGTLNLYGGTYLHKNYMRAANYAVIRIDSTNAVVNIYNDTKIGPAELIPTEASANVYLKSAGSTLNIYGGTIRNGISWQKNMSGNINALTGKVNMYGGTIIGGTYLQKEDGTVADDTINDVKASVRMAGGQFNMYGGTIQGGVSKNGGNGAAVYMSGGGTMNLMGGTIKDGRSTSYGGNVGGWTATINIGGTMLIENGYAPNGGGNLYIPDSKMIVNITGGYIRGGESKYGGNIYLNKNANGGALNISGGVIEGGVATQKDAGGGNIYVTATGVLTITGGVIKDGKATGAGSFGGNIFSQNDLTIGGNAVISGGKAVNGGNIIVPNGKTLTIEANAQVIDGEATYGGNIYTGSGAIVSSGTISGGKAELFGGNISVGTGGAFTMNGGVLANGWLTKATAGSHWGGNIRSWNGKITINDGLVYGGGGAVSNIQANNIGALGDQAGANRPALTINGGTIVGDISTSAIATKVNEETGETEITFPGTQVILTGAPKIVKSLEIDGETVEATNTGLYLANEILPDISGLTAEAEIVIDSPYSGKAVTAAFNGAAALAECFTPYEDTRYFIVLGEDNMFYHNSGEVAIMSSEENATWYLTAEEAVAAYYADGAFAKNLYLRIGAKDVTVTLAGDAYLDLAGYDVAVAGEGTVYGFDYTNDDYSGYGLLTVAEGAEVEVAAETKILKNRYITVPESGAYGFHRLAMWISDVTLRTSNPGMYYKAAYQCDSVLAGLVDSYGIALSLNAVPGIDFANESGVKYTQYGNEDFAANRNSTLVNTNSGAIVGILKDKNSQAVNTENLKRVIYANAYITFTLEGGETHTVISDSINAGKTVEDEGFKGTAYSLYDILLKVNENWDSYSDEEKLTIQTFMVKWAAYITDEAVTALQTSLDKIFTPGEVVM